MSPTDEPEMAPFIEQDTDSLGKRQNDERFSVPRRLPLLPLRGVVLYPSMWLPITIGQPRSLQLIEDMVNNRQRMLAVATSLDPQQEEPNPDTINHIGAAAIIQRLVRVPNGTIRLILQGIERINIVRYVADDPYLQAEVAALPDQAANDVTERALAQACQDLFAHLVSLSPQLPDELESAIRNVKDPRQLVYQVASSAGLKLLDAQAILELDPLAEKFRRLNDLLKDETESREIAQKIQTAAQGEMAKAQREYYLRKQMEAIQRELGQENEQEHRDSRAGEPHCRSQPAARAREGGNARAQPHAPHAHAGRGIRGHQDLSRLDGEPTLASAHR